jgi:hypothetical protein
MITRLTLRNFKSVGEQVYDFSQFDLLVGRNNSGKSTVLQALAIWQFCVDEFHRSKRSGSKGIQVVLPNFTALPVPEFNLLWKDRTDRHWPEKDGHKRQEYILIEIIVDWRVCEGQEYSFGIQLRYHSAQTIYAIPKEGWAQFREIEEKKVLPRIAYVPPFSGLEPAEERRDEAPIRKQIGKAQPGSVLRNLLLWVCPSSSKDENGRSIKGYQPPTAWTELANVINRWFSVKLLEPCYEQGVSTQIIVEYRQGSKNYDIISGGSGFHQVLTLLAFLYGYKPTTILLDEPDAHLHVNLQREILDFFKKKSVDMGIQFLIATHAEEFARGVDASQIVSLLSQVPKRIQSTPEVLRAMAEVNNEEVTRLTSSPFLLYVEGEDDERILRAWADQCGAQTAMDKICFKFMAGGSKTLMKKHADEHFAAMKQIIPNVTRLILFDYDDSDSAFHPPADNMILNEWKRKNIENYMLVSDAWKRAALRYFECEDNLFTQPISSAIDKFFTEQNLTLPPGRTWRNVSANVFSVVDGKRILFENNDSLFHQLRNSSPSVRINRDQVAMQMLSDEIHEDVHIFLNKLVALVTED